MYNIGDYVFAHIRGHLPWPAVINKIETKGNSNYYYVDFFKPKNEKGQCTSSKLFLFEAIKRNVQQKKLWKMRTFYKL